MLHTRPLGRRGRQLALVTMIAASAACKPSGSTRAPGSDPGDGESTRDTKVVSFTILGTGDTCTLMKGGVDQGQEVSESVTTQQFIKLVFTRSPSPLVFFHFDDGLPHHLVSSSPSSGTATTVSGTFDIPSAVGTHVDHVPWTADVKTPPCTIKVTIKRD